MNIIKRDKTSKIYTILTTFDSDTRKWMKYMKTIETLFKNVWLPDFSCYDNIRYLKMNRESFKYMDFDNYLKVVNSQNEYKQLQRYNDSLNYSFKRIGFRLSDHNPLVYNGIFTWNVLHHYNYNGSNDYIDSNVVRYFNAKVFTEKARYSLIATQLKLLIHKYDYKCYALQECEYSIYNAIVKSLDTRNYVCRFIPHRISYNINGVYMESFGCALIIKDSSNFGETFVNPIKSKKVPYENGYKYLVRLQNNVMYSSIHIPKCGRNNDYKAWYRYGKEDFKFILSKMRNANFGYIIGDLNMSVNTLNKFTSNFPEYNFNILANMGPDYIIKVSHSRKRSLLMIKG